MQVSAANAVARQPVSAPTARTAGPAEAEHDGDSDDRGSLAFMGVGRQVDLHA